jgi:hypothetical protein
MIFPFELGRVRATRPAQNDRTSSEPKSYTAILFFLIAAGIGIWLFFWFRSKKSASVSRPSASLPAERWKHWEPVDYD